MLSFFLIEILYGGPLMFTDVARGARTEKKYIDARPIDFRDRKSIKEYIKYIYLYRCVRSLQGERS